MWKHEYPTDVDLAFVCLLHASLNVPLLYSVVDGDHRWWSKNRTYVFVWFPPLYSSDETWNTIKSPHLESYSDIKKCASFLIVEYLNEGRNLTKLSPCALLKTIHSIAGGAKGIKKLRSAELLVEVGKPMQSAKLLKDNVFIDSNIKVDAHRSLNICNGVIDQITWSYIMHGGRDRRGIQRSEWDQCQVNLHFGDGQKRPTGTLTLTFDSPRLYPW